jgi:hypothetical protein
MKPGSGESSPEQTADSVSQGDGHKAVRFDFLQTAQQGRASHAGVDQHRDHSGLEQREDQRDEIDSGPDHQHQPHPGLDSHVQQSIGQQIAVVMQLLERALPIRVFS